LLAAQASAEELGAELLAVGEADQISMSYSLSMIGSTTERFGPRWAARSALGSTRFRSTLHSGRSQVLVCRTELGQEISGMRSLISEKA
jgi:hypothetical protein